MSALAPKSDQTHESEWIEFPDRGEISPASVWALDFEDEITVQTKRAARRLEQSAPVTDEESVPEVRPQVRILDESQVLQSEASFATVKMNQEVETTLVNPHERLSVDRFEEATVDAANQRRRILDESYVLPSEASFATGMLNEQSIDPAYSPLREFFVKSNLNWRGLAVVTLLLVSIFAGIAFFVWKITEQSVLSSHQTENTSPVTPQAQTEPAPTQAAPIQASPTQAALPTSQPAVPVAVPNRPSPAIEPSASASANGAKHEAAVATAPRKFPNASSSESSRKVSSDENKLKVPGKGPRPEAKSATRNVTAGESGKRGLAVHQKRPVKESEASKSAARGERVGIKSSDSKTVEARRESSAPAADVPVAQPKPAPTSPTVTGGAQRPRTVTPKEP